MGSSLYGAGCHGCLHLHFSKRGNIGLYLLSESKDITLFPNYQIFMATYLNI